MQLNSFYYFVSDKSVRWIIMSLFAFQIKEESGDNKEYITFESIIKVEPCDNIEDTTLLPIVKQDPDDEAEVQIWNFRENAERCFLKREVKEEKEHDDDDDDVEQDPFLMGNESFNGKSISSCVGEYGTFTESHTRVGSSWEKCNSARNKGKDLTSHNAEEKPKQNAEYNKQSENDTRFSSPDNARQEDQRRARRQYRRLLCPPPSIDHYIFTNRIENMFGKHPYAKILIGGYFNLSDMKWINSDNNLD
ncbi:Protein of unknown function, partial [Gryllus bimaculatus]